MIFFHGVSSYPCRLFQSAIDKYFKTRQWRSNLVVAFKPPVQRNWWSALGNRFNSSTYSGSRVVVVVVYLQTNCSDDATELVFGVYRVKRRVKKKLPIPVSTWTFATAAMAPSAFVQQRSYLSLKCTAAAAACVAYVESGRSTSQHHSSLGKWSVKVYILTDRTPEGSSLIE